MDAEREAERFREQLAKLEAEVGKVIVGHREVVRQVLVAVLGGGHVLLEGVPGLGKTLLVRTLAKALELKFSRIQFTPDLMPADIVGTNIVVEDPSSGRKAFEFQRGPIFGNIVLADEINRATPKTQSALLEAMQELTVTVAGTRYPLDEPFFVLATQNPIEMEGTYPLPEAQLDRFLFKVEVKASSMDDLVEILERTTGKPTPEPEKALDGKAILDMRRFAREVPVAKHVMQYAARLVLATHPDGADAVDFSRRFVRYGASPRAAQALVLGAKIVALSKGRLHVSFDDIREVAHPSLRHRLVLNFEGEAEGIHPDRIVDRLLEEVPRAPKEVERLLPTT